MNGQARLPGSSQTGRRCSLGIVLLMAAAVAWPQSRPRDSVVYVSAPFVGLLEGLFDGEVSFAELKRHGDLGLGAVNGLDGELVLLDGQAYAVAGDGSVRPLSDSERTPFATATFFEPRQTFDITEETDLAGLLRRLDDALPDLSRPYAFRIDGRFTYLQTRSVGKQRQPYRRMLDAMKEQVRFDLQDASGVMVGFRIPDYALGVAAPGYHFHFLTADRKTGGHVLALRASRLHVALERCSGISASIPQDPAFSRIRLTPGMQAEIDQILGRAPVKP